MIVDRKTEILSGQLSFPKQIMDIVNPSNNENITTLINDFWNNVFHNFMREKSCNTLLWMIKFLLSRIK